MDNNIEKPKNFAGQFMPEYQHWHTGQTLMMFQTPPEMVNYMNDYYDKGIKDGKFDEVSSNLVGKVRKEYSLYLDDNHPDLENHNFIPDDVHRWVKDRIHQYLQSLNASYMGIKTYAAWVNDYMAGEYNPNHMHVGIRRDTEIQGRHGAGLVGMMCLKVPDYFGAEITNEGMPGDDRNGYTEFTTGNPRTLFANSQTRFRFMPGDFIVFPYDMYHCLYPHFNKTQIRRSFPINIDVFLQGGWE